MNKNVVIFQAHTMDWFSRRALRKLATELKGYADVFIQGLAGEERAFPEASHGLPCTKYSRDGLLALPYPEKTRPAEWKLVPGNTDLMLLSLWREHPDYDYYWIVEYDVRYTGNWRRFLQKFDWCHADVLGTNVLRYRDTPDWNHWRSLVVPRDVDCVTEPIRAFLPLCRMSAAACAAVDAAYRAGWGGHNEVVWPTVACHDGLIVEDIGGEGPFTPEPRRGKFYTSTPKALSLTPGSFGYRPMRPFGSPVPGRLSHPVKPRECWWDAIARVKAVRNRFRRLPLIRS